MTKFPDIAAPKYDPVAKFLHWAVAVLVVTQLAIGWIMPDVGPKTRPVGLVGWHVTVGVLLLAAVAARVIWRIFHRPYIVTPELGWLNRSAQATHLLLYLLIIVVPVLGWANANSRGWIVGLTEWIKLPPIMPTGSHLGHQLGDIHGDLATVLAVVAGLHIVAGLYHHFVRRDATLRMML
jgi:cytochrome b561